jgi:hypothetical protein
MRDLLILTKLIKKLFHFGIHTLFSKHIFKMHEVYNNFVLQYKNFR